jgi:aspartyl protease family protein
MAIGFMNSPAWRPHHLNALWFAVMLLIASTAHANDISVAALFTGKAVLVINGGAPRTVSVGQSTPEGIRLISADSSSAVIELQGKRQTLTLGSSGRFAGGGGSASAGSSGSVTLAPDARGHYMTLGQINGGTVQFLVDTGATAIAIPSADARRLGINYLNGQRGYTETANGKATAYRISLDTVKVGDITLYNVEAVVLEGDGLKIALLGMSFLNRTEMKRDGQALTLIKRF